MAMWVRLVHRQEGTSNHAGQGTAREDPVGPALQATALRFDGLLCVLRLTRAPWDLPHST